MLGSYAMEYKEGGELNILYTLLPLLLLAATAAPWMAALMTMNMVAGWRRMTTPQPPARNNGSLERHYKEESRSSSLVLRFDIRRSVHGGEKGMAFV